MPSQPFIEILQSGSVAVPKVEPGGSAYAAAGTLLNPALTYHRHGNK